MYLAIYQMTERLEDSVMPIDLRSESDALNSVVCSQSVWIGHPMDDGWGIETPS